VIKERVLVTRGCLYRNK